MVANCWINWHLTVAKYAVPSGLSHRLMTQGHQKFLPSSQNVECGMACQGSCTWTNVKKRAKETSFHKANGYEWSSPSPVHCWTWTWCSALTTLPYFDPTVTASHKTWHLTLCYCSLRLQNAAICFQAKLQNRCSHLRGDRSCFSSGRSNIEPENWCDFQRQER